MLGEFGVLLLYSPASTMFRCVVDVLVVKHARISPLCCPVSFRFMVYLYPVQIELNATGYCKLVRRVSGR